MQLAIVNTKRDFAKSTLRGEASKLSQLSKSQNILEPRKGLTPIEKIAKRERISDLLSKRPRLRKFTKIEREKNKLS